MTMLVTIRLSDRDLELLQQRMIGARDAAAKRSEGEVVGAARTLVSKLRATELPDFIGERMIKLEKFVLMLDDKGWKLDGDDRQRIVSALAYLVDPNDLLPDDLPGIGYLDDAIMIELLCKELQPDIQAYEDFLVFKDKETARLGTGHPTIQQDDWLEARRAQLKDRMRRRRSTVWASRLRR